MSDWRDDPDAKRLLAFLAKEMPRSDGFVLQCVKIDGVVVAGHEKPIPTNAVRLSGDKIVVADSYHREYFLNGKRYPPPKFRKKK